jgi:hypothetical protein
MQSLKKQNLIKGEIHFNKMGILVEFNPELALRNISEYQKGNKKENECIPETLVVGETYEFLKKGQRNYWLFGEISLIETKGEGILSKPKAQIIILEATHFLIENEIYTKEKYKVIRII